MRVDRLGGLFLAVVGFVGVAVSLVQLQRRAPRATATLHALLSVAVVLVVTADHAFVFLLGWELLTLAVYLLAGIDREQD